MVWAGVLLGAVDRDGLSEGCHECTFNEVKAWVHEDAWEREKQGQSQWSGRWQDAWGLRLVSVSVGLEIWEAWGCFLEPRCTSGCLQWSIVSLNLSKGWDWEWPMTLSVSHPSLKVFCGRCEPSFYSHVYHTSSSFHFLMRIGSWSLYPLYMQTYAPA